MIYLITFAVAFCSIAYELLLGQLLSAYLGDTVLRYSVTIGLYIAGMGVGALLAEGSLVRRAATSLLAVEVVLSIVGGGAAVILGAVYSLSLPDWLFSTTAHGLVLMIGILTGFEIPLLIGLHQTKRADGEHLILGIDYIGALFGGVGFALLFYPLFGIVATALTVACINSVVGLMIYTNYLREETSHTLSLSRILFSAQATCLLILAGGLYFSDQVESSVIQQFMQV